MNPKHSIRPRLMFFMVLALFGLVIFRLFHWQVVQGSQLRAAVENQATREVTNTGKRGRIFTADGKLLVGNAPSFHLMIDKMLFSGNANDLANRVAPLLAERDLMEQEATDSALTAQELTDQNRAYLTERLGLTSNWVRLSSRLDRELMEKVQALEIPGLYFEEYQTRFYPEASMAAHITGFVGKDDAGEDTGYFGIEGALNKELTPRSRTSRFLTNALGALLGNDTTISTQSLDGRDAVLTIRRNVQFLAEQELKSAVERYGALSGEVIVLEPKTGNILALASWPTYDQARYYEFPTDLYKNPSLANTYEPGSTFKVLTVAAAIDVEAVTPDTQCPVCATSRQIGRYTIKTWNDQYQPNITIREGLAKSDNVAMIYTAEQTGRDTFIDYLKKFGIGEPLRLDLQDDITTPFPDKWGEVELATRSFGQGISVNSLQMVRAVSAIANQGVMMRPKILDKVIDHQSGKEIVLPSTEERRVISTKTAQTVTEMMVNAAQHGEAQWIFKNTHTIAGKTGTSQIPVAGGYKPDATIASFIGFAPANNPQFVMLVKLTEPRTSPWAAETAAPLWYRIAEKLFLLLNVPPDSATDELSPAS